MKKDNRKIPMIIWYIALVQYHKRLCIGSLRSIDIIGHGIEYTV